MERRGGDLSERKKLILRAIIDAYISGGEPVGSKYLTQSGQIAFSSATIRNEMAELEEMGYLRQPHTSAGRVPSERGYRFYVDGLMDSYRMTANELSELNQLVRARAAELDKILDRASHLMSMMTNYASLTARPSLSAESVLQFQTLHIDSGTMLLVMVVETGGRHCAKTVYISAPGITEAAAEQIEICLNEEISGRAIDSITLSDIIRLRMRLAAFGCGDITDRIMEAVYSVLGEEDGELRLEGVNHLLQYQEYADPEKLGGLLESLEQKNDILDMVKRGENEGINIYIGSENGLSSMRQSSLIFKKIMRGGRTVGAIGVIGPCRMKYNRVITMIEQFSRNISGMIDGDISADGMNFREDDSAQRQSKKQ